MARPQSPDYDARRQAILDASAKLFADQGFHSASIARIAEACGHSKALIYHYFQKKEDILFAVMEAHVQLLKRTADGIIAETPDAADALRAVARAFLDIYRGAQAKHIVLLNELRSLDPPQRQRIVRLERDVIAVFEGLIVAIGGDALADKAARTVATRLFMGMINWTYTWYDGEGPLSAAQIADMATETYISGLENGDMGFLTSHR